MFSKPGWEHPPVFCQAPLSFGFQVNWEKWFTMYRGRGGESDLLNIYNLSCARFFCVFSEQLPSILPAGPRQSQLREIILVVNDCITNPTTKALYKDMYCCTVSVAQASKWDLTRSSGSRLSQPAAKLSARAEVSSGLKQGVSLLSSWLCGYWWGSVPCQILH